MDDSKSIQKCRLSVLLEEFRPCSYEEDRLVMKILIVRHKCMSLAIPKAPVPQVQPVRRDYPALCFIEPSPVYFL